MSQCMMFISYSHEDESFRRELEKHLTPMKLSGLAVNWSDSKISAGKNFWGEINDHLNKAAIVLLLISPDYIASESCRHEMGIAANFADEKRNFVIPIILRYCDWNDLPVSKYLAANPDAKPITSYQDRDFAFLTVVKEIKRAVNDWIDNNNIEKSPNQLKEFNNNESPILENVIEQAIAEKEEFQDENENYEELKSITRHSSSSYSDWSDFWNTILEKLYEISSQREDIVSDIRPWGDRIILDIFGDQKAPYRFLVQDVGGQIGRPGFQVEYYDRSNNIESYRYRWVETRNQRKLLKNIWRGSEKPLEDDLLSAHDFACKIFNSAAMAAHKL